MAITLRSRWVYHLASVDEARRAGSAYLNEQSIGHMTWRDSLGFAASAYKSLTLGQDPYNSGLA